MSNIEPTEEQKQAAEDWIFNNSPGRISLARLLAEREAKLRKEEMKHALIAIKAAADEANKDVDTLRARVAELEEDARGRLRATKADLQRESAANEKVRELTARVAELEGQYSRRVQSHTEDLKEAHEREAQHLAGIKALLRSCCVAMDAIDDGDSVAARNELAEATERLAHYDDAKADAPSRPCCGRPGCLCDECDNAKADAGAEYLDKAREIACEVAAWPDWKKAGFRSGDTEGGEG